MRTEIEVTSVVCAIFLLATQVGFSIQQNGFLRPPSGCICPGSNLTFECAIEGGGTTVWSGSFITNCQTVGTEISLRHGDQFTQGHEICNNGAVTVTPLSIKNNIYTSQLNINMTIISLLNGSSVTCAHYISDRETVTDRWTMIDPPMNLCLEDANSTFLNFSWTSVFPSCPSLYYNVRTTNCGACHSKDNSTIALCENLNVTADIQVCSIAVQRRCGDNILGNVSDIFQVTLKVPEAPVFTTIPSYSWIQNENELWLNVTVNETVAFKISDKIDGSATSYTVYYSDSTLSNSCNGSATIPASLCRHGVCNRVFKVSSSSCSPSADIIVMAFATNIFGDGRHSVAGAIRSESSVIQKIYGIIKLNILGALGGVAAFAISIIVAVLTIAYLCHLSRRPIKPYMVEFYVDDKPGFLAKALEIFSNYNISVDFVDTCTSSATSNHERDKSDDLRGFHVSYDCSREKNNKVVSQLKKTFGGNNVAEVSQEEDQTSHIVVKFSVKDSRGNIAGITKILGDLNISIVSLRSGECSDNYRKFTIECICSFHNKKILIDKLKNHGAINPTIEEEVPLPPPADDIERIVIKFPIDNEVGSLHGIITSLSTIESFQRNDYSLCHVKMSTDETRMPHSVYLVCTCPRGKREQLKSDIQTATGRELQMSPREEASMQQQSDNP